MAQTCTASTLGLVALIVEDHAAVRQAMRERILASFGGFRLREAGTVQDALKIIEGEHVDIVLMDIRLPGVSGVDGTRLVLERSPSTCVIMVSLFDDVSYRSAARKAGARAFVSKRAIGRELIPAIERLMACTQ